MGIQIHFSRRRSKPSSLVRRSEPLSQLSFPEPLLQFQVFRAILPIGIQSHHFLTLTLRVIIFIGVQSHFPQLDIQSHSSHKRSEPPTFSIGLQSHSPHRRSEPPFSFISIKSHFHSLGVLSHHFLPQAFRATFSSLGVQSHFPRLDIQSYSPHMHSEPPTFSIGLQSHSPHRNSKPPLSFIGIQSHFHPLGIQSYHFLSQVFKVVGLQSYFSHWRSKPEFQVFKAIVQLFKIVHLSLGIQSHISSVQSYDFPGFVLLHCV